MDVKEHFYRDDPARGPADVRTTLPGVEYFFLGNGHIQAAVQVCRSGAGTPVGLLIMHPQRLGPKRDALTLDPEFGLAPTLVRVGTNGQVNGPAPGQLDARWTDLEGIPAVCVTWRNATALVEERFWCPDRTTPRVVREIRLQNMCDRPDGVTVHTGAASQRLERSLTFDGHDAATAVLDYRIAQHGSQPAVQTRWCEEPVDSAAAARYWRSLGNCRFSSALLEHLFRVSRNHIPAVIGASGMIDGGIWQYNLEWLRDQAAMACALLRLGDFELARTILNRLLRNFVSDEGDTVDSGRLRGPEDVELDQGGALLLALQTYIDWTGDTELIREHWPKIHAVAEFPLRDVFRHPPSGLLHNQREFWERHAVHGIRDGLELAHQLFVSLGLSAAASLARAVRQPEDGARWQAEGLRLWQAMRDERSGLVDQGHFIKRREIGGAVQVEIEAQPAANLPAETPLMAAGPHYLNPDTSSVLPIVLELVDPRGPLARQTLEQIEQLWNQRWEGGGYGRYHVSSEPDSPGPWPFPSVFVAQADCEAGNDERVWRVLNWLGSVSGGRAGSWLEFYGPRPVPPYPQVGIIPWTWAELVGLCIHHILGVRPSESEVLIRPRLLDGLDRAEADLRLQGHMLHLVVRRAPEGEEAHERVGTQMIPWSATGLHLPWPAGDASIEAIVPS